MPMKPSGGGPERKPQATCAWGAGRAVQQRVGLFLAGLSHRKAEVRQRCRTVLQVRAEALLRNSPPGPSQPNAHPTLALV